MAAGLRSAVLLGAAAVVLTTGVVLVSAADSRDGDASPPAQQPSPSLSPKPLPPFACPASTDPARLVVPTRPTGYDGAARLVPEAVPARVVVCRYESGSGALAGTRELEGDLAAVPEVLHLPRKVGDRGPCTLMGGPLVPYLVRLDYADGAGVWLATRDDVNSCEDVTNGSFTSPAYLGRQLQESFDAGAWATPPTPRGSCVVSGNRAGQELALVPDGWSSLRVCADQPIGTGRAVSQDVAERVAQLVGDLETFPGDTSASCDGGAEIPGGDRTLHLAWSYPSGRDVWVILFAGCEPALTNGSVAADPGDELQVEFVRLLEGD